MFKYFGCYTAIITPFKNHNHVVDIEAFKNLIQIQVDTDVDGIVISGTTGESPTLTFDEKITLVKEAIKICDGKCKIMVGTGGNNTQNVIYETNEVSKIKGVDCVLLVNPYYNKPNDECLKRHFTEIHNKTNIDIMLYNVPGRTGIDISDDTVIELSKLDRIVGIKHSISSVSRIANIRHNSKSSFSIMCGDDENMLAFNANGANGVISVASNIVPSVVVDIQSLCKLGNFKEAFQSYVKYLALYKGLFLTTSPIPVKYLLSKKGLCEFNLREPLYAVLNQNEKSFLDSLLNLYV